MNLQHAKTWEELPDVWKAVERVSKVEYSPNIEDKGLAKIFSDITSEDALRPAMQCVHFEKDSITGTNAYVILSLPANSLKEGNFLIDAAVSKKNGIKLYSKIEDKYPDIQYVLSSVNENVHTIDVYKLKTYAQAVINGNYPNKVTNQIVFKIKDNERCSFNGKLLITLLDKFLMLGVDKLYMSYKGNKNMFFFSPNKEAVKDPIHAFGKHLISVIMPLSLHGYGESYLGAADIDYDTEISVYYSFEDDEIHNADGSVAIFDSKLSNKELPYIGKDELNLLKLSIDKNTYVPITELVIRCKIK